MTTEKTMWQRILALIERTSFPLDPKDADAITEASAYAASRHEFMLPELMAVAADRSQARKVRRVSAGG